VQEGASCRGETQARNTAIAAVKSSGHSLPSTAALTDSMANSSSGRRAERRAQGNRGGRARRRRVWGGRGGAWIGGRAWRVSMHPLPSFPLCSGRGGRRPHHRVAAAAGRGRGGGVGEGDGRCGQRAAHQRRASHTLMREESLSIFFIP
jgi:hypothetical protein